MRITKQMAADAATKITKPLNDKVTLLEQKLSEAATVIYERQIPKAVMEFFDKYPNYINTRSHIYENVVRNITLTKNLPETTYDFTQKERETLQKIKHSIDAAEINRKDKRREIENMILALGTYNKVAESLPEAIPYITAPSMGTALMLNVTPVRNTVKKLIKEAILA